MPKKKTDSLARQKSPRKAPRVNFDADTDEVERWKAQAKEDGFRNFSAWIRRTLNRATADRAAANESRQIEKENLEGKPKRG